VTNPLRYHGIRCLTPICTSTGTPPRVCRCAVPDRGILSVDPWTFPKPGRGAALGTAAMPRVWTRRCGQWGTMGRHFVIGASFVCTPVSLPVVFCVLVRIGVGHACRVTHVPGEARIRVVLDGLRPRSNVSLSRQAESSDLLQRKTPSRARMLASGCLATRVNLIYPPVSPLPAQPPFS